MEISPHSQYFEKPMNRLFLLLTLWITIPARAGFVDIPSHARSMGMGSSSAAMILDSGSWLTNPACLAGIPAPSLSISIFHPFGLKELSSELLSGVCQTSLGGIGIVLKTFGNAIYRENGIRIGWAHHLVNRLYYGFALRLNQLRIEKYGSDTSFSLDAGLLFRLTDGLSMSASWTNLTGSRIGDHSHLLPLTFRIGLGCIPAPDFCLTAQIDKDTQFPAEFRGGCEWKLNPSLWFRLGFQREPSAVTGGFGLRFGLFTWDYGFSIHPVLGASHLASLSIHQGKQAQKEIQ